MSEQTHSVVSIGITQMTCAPDPAVNLKKQLLLFDNAVAQGAQILCTQELYASQYFCQSEEHCFFQLAESIPGPSTDAFCAYARKNHVVIVASLFEKCAAGLYHNTAAVIDADGSVIGLYRKMHIPDDPFYYEKFYFTPGDLGFKTFKTRYAKIGVLICWDQWFPEAARLTALQGAQVIFYPTAIGWHPCEKAEYGAAQHDSWETIQRSHAIANGCFVCSPNRVGLEKTTPVNPDGIEFWGQSFIASPDGRIVLRGDVAREQALVAQCDLSRVEFSRTHWPFLRDRRIDAYGDLTKRHIESI